MGTWARNNSWKYIKIGPEADDLPATPPSGKITITENGTDIDVSTYATADVQVEGGSSDFSTAELTFVVDAGENLVILQCSYIYDDEILAGGSYGEGTVTLDAVQYKGSQVAWIYSEDTENLVISATGSATVGEYGAVTITGPCTITVTVGT